MNAVESALVRPQNLAAYGTPDAADLTAAYAFGVARNQGFLESNKCTAWVTARLFLADNDDSPRFDPAIAVLTLEAVAAGLLEEAALPAWFRDRLANSTPANEAASASTA